MSFLGKTASIDRFKHLFNSIGSYARIKRLFYEKVEKISFPADKGAGI
jgi:hypothetical protein